MKNKKGNKQIFYLELLISIVLISLIDFTAGCTSNVVIKKEAPLLLDIARTATHIGLYTPKEFIDYQVIIKRGVEKINYTNLGKVSYTQFLKGLEHVFNKVTLVDGKPPFSDSEGILPQAVIELQIDKFDAHFPLTRFQTISARINYIIRAYNMLGQELFTKTIEGIGEVRIQGIHYNPADILSQVTSQAINDGVTKSLRTISSAIENEQRLGDAQKKLEKMKSQGLITDDEFLRLKGK